MICLSKNLTDEYINMFAQGADLPIHDYNYDFGTSPIVIRSMAKRKLIDRCYRDNIDFYYMDSGYFGNYPGPTNPNGWKLYHRIVKNDVQHNEIIDRPDDRWRKLDLKLYPRKEGKHILLVVPSEKPCNNLMIIRVIGAARPIDSYDGNNPIPAVGTAIKTIPITRAPPRLPYILGIKAKVKI